MKIAILFLMCILSPAVFGQQEVVEFNLDAPENVVAGNEFEVTLTFNKGDLKDYSRFSQDLPSGFTATNVISPNADFTFADQRIRIIWLKLPEEKDIQVKYAVDVHERLKGKLELTGTFAYVHEGERAYINLLEPVVVNILPNPNIDQNLVVDISEFHTIRKSKNIVEPEKAEAAGEGFRAEDELFSQVVRQKPVIGANGIVYVNVLVKNPEGSNFLKLEESIPGGYSFESLDAQGAVVSQAASLARFVWMKPPEASVFLIRYRLVPVLERNQAPLVIEGNLTYTNEGESAVARVREIDVNLASLNTAQQEKFLKTGSVDRNLADAGETLLDKKETEVKKPVKETVIEPVSSTVSERDDIDREMDVGSALPVKSSGPTVIDIVALEAVSGVSFRVQIAAVRNPYFTNVVFAGHDLLRDVKVEKINGLNKYTVGPLTSYEEANRLKIRINRETVVESAFVVGYKDGKRVPLDTLR
ncbi:MAG: hypothetical protein WD577_12325 [Bacteroidales bacterium]